MLATKDYDVAVGGTENNRWLRMATSDRPAVAAWGRPDVAIQDWTVRRMHEVVGMIGTDKLSLVGALSYGRWPRHGRCWNGDPAMHPWDDAVLGKP